MNIQFIFISLMYLIFNVFLSVLCYKIFLNYRYKELYKIDLNNLKNAYNPKFICGLDIYECIEAIIWMAVLGFLQFLIIRNFVFNNPDSYIYFVGLYYGYLVYFFPFLVICYIIRAYNTYKDDYQSFLYWECFLYKGPKPKLFWDDPKYRKNSYVQIRKTDIITQAENEKKWVKILIIILFVMMLIFHIPTVMGMTCFSDEKIIISYHEYEYSDITAIYKTEKFKSFTGEIKDISCTYIIFNDEAEWGYSDEEISKHAKENFVETVSERSGIEITECEILPDNLHYKRIS